MVAGSVGVTYDSSTRRRSIFLLPPPIQPPLPAAGGRQEHLAPPPPSSFLLFQFPCSIEVFYALLRTYSPPQPSMSDRSPPLVQLVNAARADPRHLQPGRPLLSLFISTPVFSVVLAEDEAHETIVSLVLGPFCHYPTVIAPLTRRLLILRTVRFHYFSQRETNRSGPYFFDEGPELIPFVFEKNSFLSTPLLGKPGLGFLAVTARFSLIFCSPPLTDRMVTRSLSAFYVNAHPSDSRPERFTDLTRLPCARNVLRNLVQTISYPSTSETQSLLPPPVFL